MADPEQSRAVSPSQQYWWAEAWAAARPRFILMATETMISVGLLCALGIIYLALRLLTVAGVPAEDLDFLKQADLWAVKAVFLSFSLSFVFQSVLVSYTSVARLKMSHEGMR